jgi:hypothetical protein
MPLRFEVLLKEWKEIDRAATAAERELIDAMEAALQGKCSLPSDEQVLRAKELREKERWALQAALDYMDGKAHAHRPK